jgi:hypothetical protein
MAAEGWELLPADDDDPRFDEHGFRMKAHAARRSRPSADGATGGNCNMRWQRRSTPHELSRRPLELKWLVRQGIPATRRSDVWIFLSRAETLCRVEPDDYFTSLLECPDGIGRADASEYRTARQINLDVSRTFPSHRVFGAPAGRERLRAVLLAYSRRNPVVGYVQGMGFLAAVLLLFLDDEAAFWCLSAMIERLLPDSFFSPSLLGLRAELAAFGALVDAKLPRLASHLSAHGVVPELYATRWFIAGFATSLPMGTVLRIWDAFFCEGIKVFHRIGLALLKVCEARLLACREQHHFLCALQEEEARCHDVGRLFALAFDTRSFIGPFPRSRLFSLRARYLSALSGDDRCAEERRAAAARAVRCKVAQPDNDDEQGDGSVMLRLAPPGAHASLGESAVEDGDTEDASGASSDEEQHSEAIVLDPFEMISVDDLYEPPAWL